MCTVCGCSSGPKIDGQTHAHSHAHDHAHSHGDLTHSNPHAHSHSHDHDHTHGDHDHAHSHGADHDHHHYGEGAAGVSVPGMSQARLIQIETDILAKNNAYAASNRRVLTALDAFAVNLVSSPGSGKTTLLWVVSQFENRRT